MNEPCPREGFEVFMQQAQGVVATQEATLPRRKEFHPHSGSTPRTAPPNYIPNPATAHHPSSHVEIERCLYGHSYLWLQNNQQFWFFPTFVGESSIAGYRWINRDWVYKGFGLDMIEGFYCSGN